MRPLLILFAKAPVPGRVKTRLIPPLTPQSAARLTTAFVFDMIESLQTLRRNTDLQLHTDIATDVWSSTRVAQSLQGEGDLGLKMLQAIRRALHAGHPQVMIIGTDAPTLPLEHLKTLLDSRADIALGPTLDGGFYAIASRRVDDRLFQGVTWSAESTMATTQAAVERCGLSLEIGPAWYDVDVAADLHKLANDPALPRHTQAVLENGETWLNTN